MRTKQMSQCHTACFFDELYDRFVVLCNDQDSLLLWLPGARKGLGRIEALTVRVKLAGCGDDIVRFRFLRRVRGEQLGY